MPSSKISAECVDCVLENCQTLHPFVALLPCVFVLVIPTPLKLTRSQAQFAHSRSNLHQPAATQQDLTYMCHSGLVPPMTGRNPGPSSTQLTGVQTCAGILPHLQPYTVTKLSL